MNLEGSGASLLELSQNLSAGTKKHHRDSNPKHSEYKQSVLVTSSCLWSINNGLRVRNGGDCLQRRRDVNIVK
jgi:hypothetical protein